MAKKKPYPRTAHAKSLNLRRTMVELRNDVVVKLDKRAVAMGCSRTALIRQVLADYLGVKPSPLKSVAEQATEARDARTLDMFS